MIRKLLLVLAVLIPAVAVPCTMKTWTGTEIVQSSDLNANFLCLNTKPDSTTPGAGVVTNSMVSNTAAIATSKLADHALMPRAWANMSANCDGAAAAGTACTVAAQYPSTITIKSNGAAGQFRVHFGTGYVPATANFMVLVQSTVTNLGACTPLVFLAATGDANGTNFVVHCWNTTTLADIGVATGFFFTVFENI